MHPLIAPEEVDGSQSLYDLRWDLVDRSKGRADYETGHIPGAFFVDLDRDLAAPPGERGRHPLPPVDEFTATLGRLGISRDTHVVVYDDAAGRIAARMWWMLRSIGHENVQVLDGGFAAWTGATESGWNEPSPASYPAVEGYTGVVEAEELDERTVVDARASERYRGEFEPVDPKAGHIPGAVNIPTSSNLAQDGRFLTAEALAQVYADLPSDPVVSCGSGVTACHDALAMVAAGMPMPDVYVGSFSEWSTKGLPVEIGDSR